MSHWKLRRSMFFNLEVNLTQHAILNAPPTIRFGQHRHIRQPGEISQAKGITFSSYAGPIIDWEVSEIYCWEQLIWTHEVYHGRLFSQNIGLYVTKSSPWRVLLWWCRASERKRKMLKRAWDHNSSSYKFEDLHLRRFRQKTGMFPRGRKAAHLDRVLT